MNPFDALYAVCNADTAVAKYAALPAGPSIVDIEPVGLCNMRCVMCPTGLQALGRAGGFMSAETFQAILDKTAPFKSAIRFIGWGEPTMHFQLPEFIRLAAAAGRLTHLNTNGSILMTRGALANKLVAAGLSSIKFSFQGTDPETYYAMRRTDFFEDLLRAIARMREARDSYGLGTPFIAASTTITVETPRQVLMFRERLEPLVDHLGIGSTIFEFIDMAAVPLKQRALLEEAAAAQTVVKRHPSPCPEIYDKISIHWDGSVRVCCNDYSGRTNLGNIVTDEFPSIWRHPIMEEYRVRVAEGRYEGPLCGSCWDYMSCTKGT